MISPESAIGEREVRVASGDWALNVVVADTVDVCDQDSIDASAAWIRAHAEAGGLAFLLCDSSARTLTQFIQLLGARIPVALINAAWDAAIIDALLGVYRPQLIFSSPGTTEFSKNYSASDDLPGVWLGDAGPWVHPDLAVLLTTSGSTGSPKFVRLSRTNIEANGRQIVASLGIASCDRAVTTLPLHYSFGLSVVTSHAMAGGTVVLTSESVVSPAFWSVMNEHEVSFMAGVPQSLGMIRRLKFDEMHLPHLRVLAQAGGRLSDDSITYFNDSMIRRGGRFHVMYGQTEASPRMTCLPAGALPDKVGSVGIPMPGGSIRIVDAAGAPLPAGDIGEIEYSGPNVMLGYSESRADLAKGDEQGSVLRTGDLGFLDQEGLLFLVGRTKRIAKIASARVSLDEVEAMAYVITGVSVGVVASETDGLVAFAEGIADDQLHPARRELAGRLRVPPAIIDLRRIDALPLLASGKIDYGQLTSSL